MRRLNSFIAKQPPATTNIIYSVNPLEVDQGEFNPVEEKYYVTADAKPSYSIVDNTIHADFHAILKETIIDCPVKTLWIPEINARAVIEFSWLTDEVLKIELHQLDNNALVNISSLSYFQFPFTISTIAEKNY
jgi:hypothetical protein